MLPIEDSINILKENSTCIRTISEWAEKMGHDNRDVFSLKFRRHFKKRPSEVFYVLRMEAIIDYMSVHPDQKNYAVALEFGFANEKGLNKFVKRHSGLTPTEIRKRVTQTGNANG